MHPGVATQVTTVNKDDISKISPLLAVLQALASKIATPIIDNQSINSLHDIIQNPYINNTISMLQAHVRRLFFHKSIILTTDSVEEHDAILKAF